MAKNVNDEFDILRSAKVPAPERAARERAISAAMQAFDAADEKNAAAPQGVGEGARLTDRTIRFWREVMQKKLVSIPALAGLVALPVAGVVGWQLMEEIRPSYAPAEDMIADGAAPAPQAEPAPAGQPIGAPTPNAMQEQAASPKMMTRGVEISTFAAPAAQPRNRPAPALLAEPQPMQSEDRERFANAAGSPIKSVAENPVSTFSIDVDTASYAFVRRSLKEGLLPDIDSVRVEEIINYFPYDWAGPQSADVPFNSTITVMPTPWNENTQLMHVAIKGYDVVPTDKPRSNLVFLIDTSGSMEEPDKLPLLKNSFRLLLDQLGAEDTVSIVTYAGSAGTALEPTKASDKAAIMAALDNLNAGGSTAGEEGIREAYRLAEKSFVEGGVNRVMLATDGDFNVGQTSDEDLKELIEDKRESGVYLSVLGFGRGNLNDGMMQTLAQNGNGTAAYIDTLAEAEKVLVQEASSSLFTIAQDVKIQVEFNPQQIAEYRLIGYETRALAREDFNNDRVDAGDIGSGHSVTAIYEITPVGSSAQMIDDLRYGKVETQGEATASSGEIAFVKVRYKEPGETTSKLIETPVTAENAIDSFDAAGVNQRFSVAVAAFGQKLRKADAVADLGYDKILEIANAARGADPFGYRAEFLQMVRLAAALDEAKR